MIQLPVTKAPKANLSGCKSPLAAKRVAPLCARMMQKEGTTTAQARLASACKRSTCNAGDENAEYALRNWKLSGDGEGSSHCAAATA